MDSLRLRNITRLDQSLPDSDRKSWLNACAKRVWSFWAKDLIEIKITLLCSSFAMALSRSNAGTVLTSNVTRVHLPRCASARTSSSDALIKQAPVVVMVQAGHLCGRAQFYNEIRDARPDMLVEQ